MPIRSRSVEFENISSFDSNLFIGPLRCCRSFVQNYLIIACMRFDFSFWRTTNPSPFIFLPTKVSFSIPHPHFISLQFIWSLAFSSILFCSIDLANRVRDIIFYLVSLTLFSSSKRFKKSSNIKEREREG